MLERVFLSYSQEDEQWVSGLRDDLLKKLRPPKTLDLIYFAPMSNRHGTEWEKHLWEALKQSPVVLLVVSRASASSSWVRREAVQALALRQMDNRRLIIPLMLTPDAGCLSKLDPELEKFHFISFFPQDDHTHYAAMLKALVYDLKHLDDIRNGRPPGKKPPFQVSDALGAIWKALVDW